MRWESSARRAARTRLFAKAEPQLSSEPVSKMGSAGDPPAPVGDPPTGTTVAIERKARWHWRKTLFPFRPASRRTAQAGSLCYPDRFFRQNLSPFESYDFCDFFPTQYSFALVRTKT